MPAPSSRTPPDPSFAELLDAVERLAGSGDDFHEVELRVGKSRLRVSRGPAGVHGVAAAVPVAPPVAAPSATAEAATANEGPGPGLEAVASPMVGTFYRRPRPEAEPFVKPGDRVEKGQVLCIIEAMKLMNNIEAETSGEIVEVVPEDGAAVQFGDRLFVIRPA